MSRRYEASYLTAGYDPLKVPDAPTIGTALAGNTQATVAFTAPTNPGESAITSYTAISTPGCFTASAAGTPIVITGLTNGTSYQFRVYATNSYGPSAFSALSNSVTPTPTGQQAYTTAGTFSYVVPTFVTSISVVSVGAGGGGGGTNGSCARGGGGGGALAYANNISVTPGETLNVIVGTGGTAGASGANGGAGGESALQRSTTYLVRAGGGGGGITTAGGTGGSVLTGTGGAGGAGGSNTVSNGAGGGGAGGYSGAGGAGVSGGAGFSGNGGGGGGGGAGDTSTRGGSGGGGVGILGQGCSGAGGTGGSASTGGGGGSGGAAGTNSSSDAGGAGGAYGGGGGGANDDGAAGAAGAGGAVRIIWPGTTRSFPSTNTGDL